MHSHPIERATIRSLLCFPVVSCVFGRRDSHNLLRPETLESLYYLYWVTGEEGYRDQAWAIFEAIEEHCRVSRGGYAGLRDVTNVRAALFCLCVPLIGVDGLRLPLGLSVGGVGGGKAGGGDEGVGTVRWLSRNKPKSPTLVRCISRTTGRIENAIRYKKTRLMMGFPSMPRSYSS